MRMRTLGYWVALPAIALLCVIAGCMSNNGADSETPFEVERYPALQSHLEAALAQLCASLGHALDARYVTDTAQIPGLAWPFEIPARRHVGSNQPIDSTISWGVGYDVQTGATRYIARWDLGRRTDTGTIGFDSPIVATDIGHHLIYSRVDGFGDDQSTWAGTLNVSLEELDAGLAHFSADIKATRREKGECGESACDKAEIYVTEGGLEKVGDNLGLSTVSGVLTGLIQLTEFDVILARDAVYIWEVSGTIANGVATATLTSGDFTQTATYSLCP